jgi:hypothetical protein
MTFSPQGSRGHPALARHGRSREARSYGAPGSMCRTRSERCSRCCRWRRDRARFARYSRSCDRAAARRCLLEPSDAIPLLESSLEDIQIYFHIPVVTRAETVARNDPILIEDPHASETRSAPDPDSSQRKKCELVVAASDQRVDAVIPAATVTMTDAVSTATVTMRVRSIAPHHLG